MRSLERAKASAVLMAVGLCVVLGTFGWFAIGFGIVTDCTNVYLCDETGCPPCDATSSWITMGGLAQLALAAAGVAVLAVGGRWKRSATELDAAAASMVLLSLIVVFGTTAQARAAYCQPGDDTSAITGERAYC